MSNNTTITIRRTITTTATAIAILHSDNGNINGTIHFQQDKNSTTISGEIKGLTPGLHGFHVHQYGDTTNGCISAGPHFNPYNKTHGDPTDEMRHVGDLGNIVAGADGTAHIDISDKHVQLLGEFSIISFVVHACGDQDDLGRGVGDKKDASLKTGDAGARVACGIVAISAARSEFSFFFFFFFCVYEKKSDQAVAKRFSASAN
uniref:Superoxide dismutase [Cu-Zn] n=1 Tax=Brugia malayi TaxID=6279 RepID=Q0GGV6_BRUMA|nr:extracellular Cu/Zn superoxide dismutase [Brugia malayi]